MEDHIPPANSSDAAGLSNPTQSRKRVLNGDEGPDDTSGMVANAYVSTRDTSQTSQKKEKLEPADLDHDEGEIRDASPGMALIHQEPQTDMEGVGYGVSHGEGKLKTLIGNDHALATNAGQCDRYFPGFSDVARFCVFCASQSHERDKCPNKFCRFCQLNDHSHFGCPLRQRCAKCRQLGHGRDSCQEKLLSLAEETECAICSSQGHLETACIRLWRTFSPDPENTRKIQNLPVYCYLCGKKGHYGPECGLNDARSVPHLGGTWTKANLERFIDQDSRELGIAATMPDGAVLADRPNLGGRSLAPQRHIFFEDDDDEEEEEEFIRPRAQPQNVARAQISFARTNSNRNGRKPSRNQPAKRSNPQPQPHQRSRRQRG